MAITVGTNAYVTEEEYLAYAADGGEMPNYASLQYDIVKSARFIDTYYNFKGQQLSDAQSMKLPTDQVTIDNIKNAALKAVEMQQAGLLTLDLASVASGQVKREMKKLGTMEKEIEYVEGSQQTFKRKAPELDMLLRPYVVGGTSSGLVRV